MVKATEKTTKAAAVKTEKPAKTEKKVISAPKKKTAEDKMAHVIKVVKKAKVPAKPEVAQAAPALASASAPAPEKETAAAVIETAPAAASAATSAAPRQPKKDKLGRSQAVGKKKNAIARVIIRPGRGQITVNTRALEDYFPRPVLQMIIKQPFILTNRDGQFDVVCNMQGGGLSGQAYALRHGISRCLDLFEPELHTALKRAGFLTRDSRVVERKKPGLSKARKRFQFSKR